MRERNIEAALVRGVKELGGQAKKLTSVKGDPDRIVLLPGGKINFVELKSPTGVVSQIQLYRFKQLRGLGFDVYVLSSMDMVNMYLKIMGELL